jgi:hypothetical protein
VAAKRLTALELPDEEDAAQRAQFVASAPVPGVGAPAPATEAAPPPGHSIPLPPIPPAPKREIMVQLSVKAPNALVERLERMTKATGAQKQAVLAAALNAYLGGHGY